MKDKPNNAFDFEYESVSKILWFCNTALRDTLEIDVSTLYEPIMAFPLTLIIRGLWHGADVIWPVTKRSDGRPRRFARYMAGFPWLWCGCGDSLEDYDEVRSGQCWICRVSTDSSTPR